MLTLRKNLKEKTRTSTFARLAVESAAVAVNVPREAPDAEEKVVADVATFRVRTVLTKRIRMRMETLSLKIKDLLVSIVEGLAMKMLARNIRKVKEKRKKVARASRIVSTEVSAVKREEEADVATVEDPEGVAVAEAVIVKKPMELLLVTRMLKRVMLVFKLRRLSNLSKNVIAEVDVEVASVEAEAELLPLKVKRMLRLVPMESTLPAVEAEEAVVATEKIVAVAVAISMKAKANFARAVKDLLAVAEAAIALTTVPRVATVLKRAITPRRTRASTIRTTKNTNKSNNRKIIKVRSSTLAPVRSLRKTWLRRKRRSR